ncbi:MAG TPA: hypothetical protein VGS07_30505 [Thermoanaerobaculia bacterium]|jgi:hypothetical protein|nr:hypothetical protein [Thermoanaerobaculia bacterium]
MSAARIAVVAVGLLLAAGALVLVVRGFSGTGTAPAAAAAEATAGGGREQEKAPPPRWQSFQRPDERVAPPRPVVRFAQGVPDPFNRPFNRPERRAEGVARPENPGFRLEGISAGAGAVALISGHAVREGETISGFRVVRIGRSGVALAGPQGAHLDLALGEGGR